MQWLGHDYHGHLTPPKDPTFGGLSMKTWDSFDKDKGGLSPLLEILLCPSLWLFIYFLLNDPSGENTIAAGFSKICMYCGKVFSNNSTSVFLHVLGVALQVLKVLVSSGLRCFAKECHFVSVKRQIDKAPLPQWLKSPTGFSSNCCLCSAFLKLSVSDRNRIHCDNWSGARCLLPSALLHPSPLWSWHGLAGTGPALQLCPIHSSCLQIRLLHTVTCLCR